MSTSAIRKMKKDDCQTVVAIHLAAFQGFFLSFLGEKFLTVFYRCLLADSSGIALISETDEHKIVGFVAGSDHPKGLYRDLLKKYWFEFAWASLEAFAKKPSILPRLLRGFTLPSHELPEPDCATLMSIAVDPQYQGHHIGLSLLDAFLEESVLRNVKYVNLTTDAINNDMVNSFYQAHGFRLFRTYTTPENRQINEYLIKIG